MVLPKEKIYRGIIKAYYIDDDVSFFRKILHFISKMKSYEAWYENYNKLMASYSGKSRKLSLMTHEEEVSSKYWCGVDDPDKLIDVPFENVTVKIPQNYDTILTNMYGDYMKPPKVENRGKWHNDQIIFEPDIPYKEYLKEN